MAIRQTCLTRRDWIDSWIIVASGVNRRGGLERANYFLVRRLAERCQHVTVICFDADADLDGQNLITVLRLRPLLGPDIFREEQLRLQSPGVIRSLLRKTPGSIVVVNGGNCCWRAVNWVHCIYKAWQPRDRDSPGWFKLKNRAHFYLARRSELKALRQARFAIAVSDKVKQEIRTLGISAPVTVVRPGSDDIADSLIVDRSNGSAFRGGPGSAFTILFVSGLGYDNNKNLDTVLRALVAVADCNVCLLIAGAGRAHTFWKERCAQLAIGNRVRFVGFCDDMPRLFAAADLLVAPSYYEAYGVAMHEAASRGIPVITHENTGFAELYPKTLADFLTKTPDDVDELAAKIRRCYASPECARSAFTEFGAKLRTFTWAHMADSIIDYVQPRWLNQEQHG